MLLFFLFYSKSFEESSWSCYRGTNHLDQTYKYVLMYHDIEIGHHHTDSAQCRVDGYMRHTERKNRYFVKCLYNHENQLI